MGSNPIVRFSKLAPRHRLDLSRHETRTPFVDRRRFLAAAAAAPFALAAAPRALAHRTGGTPLALVTADLESRVTAVHLPSGRIYRHLPTIEGPRSIESIGGTRAVVGHPSQGAITLLEGRTLEIRRVLRGFGEPRYVSARSDGLYGFVTDSGRGDVAVVDVVRARVVARLELGGPARHVSLDPSGRILWVALGSKARELAVVDVTAPEAPRLRRLLRPPFLAHDVGFTPRGWRVWVTSGDRGAIAVYDSRTHRILFRIPAGSPPQHVTFIDRAAFVTSGDDGTLDVHALDGRVLRSVRIPGGSYNVQHGFGLVLTPSLAAGTLCLLDARGKLLRQVRAARSSHDACFVMSA